MIGADCRASCAKLIAALSRQATVVDAAAAHAARLIAKSAPEGAAEHRGFWEADGTCDLADLSDRARWMGEESEGAFQPLFLDEAAKALSGLGEQQMDIAVADAVAAADRLRRQPGVGGVGQRIVANRGEPRRAARMPPPCAVTIASGVTPSADTSRS